MKWPWPLLRDPPSAGDSAWLHIQPLAIPSCCRLLCIQALHPATSVSVGGSSEWQGGVHIPECSSQSQEPKGLGAGVKGRRAGSQSQELRVRTPEVISENRVGHDLSRQEAQQSSLCPVSLLLSMLNLKSPVWARLPSCSPRGLLNLLLGRSIVLLAEM